jgi:hypothetical protein
MATVIRVKATVLPGGRVEVTDPTLPVGRPVEVVVTVPESVPTETPRKPTLLEWLGSLPPGPRSAESWEEFERQFQEERNSWDR